MLRPQPQIGEFDDGPYWEYCKKDELRVQRCKRCGRFLWPVVPACPYDFSEELEWTRVSETGTVSSWVVYHRVYHPEFKDVVPYICANIEVPEGVRFTGNVFGPDGEIKADDILKRDRSTNALNGRRVKLFFEDCGHNLKIPQWKLMSG
jgi:uncharacterized OB-fold protein